MSAIHLLDGPQRSLVRFVQATKPALDPDSYTVGGGTVLEARWHHRHSTDVDLFAHPDALASATAPDRGMLRQTLLKLTENTGERFHIGYDFVTAELSEAPISPIAERSMTTNPISDQRVAEFGVRTQTSEDILAKKFGLRILEDRTLEPRDFYDLVWAGTASRTCGRA